MSVFEGRAWISNQGLLDVSIEVDNGYISSVKKTNLEPNKEKVGAITSSQVREIAEIKMPDLNASDIDSAMRMVSGTARSMGVTVEG